MGLHRKMFEGPVPPDLLCSLCGHVLVQPESSVSCQHIFCSSCLQENVATPCPSCGTALQSVPHRPAPAQLRLRLLELRIHCDHKCSQVVALGQLPYHVSHVCPNTPVECQFAPAGCRKKVRRCQLDEHAQECDFRPVVCDACGHQTLSKDLHVHQSRKRCVEKRIKNQLIKALRSTRKEVKRHQGHLQRQQVRSDQFQRRLEIEHTKRLSTARRQRQMQKNYNITIEDTSDSCADSTVGPTTTTTTLDAEATTLANNTIPTITFSALKNQPSYSHAVHRKDIGNRSSDPSRTSMNRELGSVTSPRDAFSREKPTELQASADRRASVSRERPGYRLNDPGIPERFTTSRERYDQTMARVTASRERQTRADFTQHPQLFLTSTAADREENGRLIDNDVSIQFMPLNLGYVIAILPQ
ncbi:E3 ubiquitin-protein ligase nrdp1 [Plakobranchus ocellatus]|uniref:E3 ubiquitin-protein ligase nrdp1 n=1 Tax=Plakobranchus ocellatus TaxID=259542 RepID=A0AAV4D4F8_9GAST|nr:E3 ubiquitin-protein ligase nrdp1 [Plakobranchus ocellatus]